MFTPSIVVSLGVPKCPYGHPLPVSHWLCSLALKCHQVSLARPSEGWSVNMLPVRSTVSTPPRIYMEVHAFNARTVSVDSTPTSTRPLGFFDGRATAPLVGPFRIRSVQATWVACEVLRKSW